MRYGHLPYIIEIEVGEVVDVVRVEEGHLEHVVDG